jgi:hypothetical protein
MIMRSSGPALLQDAATSPIACPVAADDWGGLREAGLLQTGGREPLVLAFVSKLAVAGDEADVERIRAEVRGLGVTMLLISHDAVWCFGADDSLRKVRAPADVEAAALRDLFDHLGALVGADAVSLRADGAGGSGLRAVFVIDPGFVLRFAHVVAAGRADDAQPARSPLDLLLRALVAASVAFERRRTPGVRLSFNELTTLAVVSGMQRVLQPQHSQQGQQGRIDRQVAGGQRPDSAAQAASLVVPPLVVAPVLPWSPRLGPGRPATEPARHTTVRNVDAAVPSAHGASS